MHDMPIDHLDLAGVLGGQFRWDMRTEYLDDLIGFDGAGVAARICDLIERYLHVVLEKRQSTTALRPPRGPPERRRE